MTRRSRICKTNKEKRKKHKPKKDTKEEKNRKHSEKKIQNEVATRNTNISVTRITYQSTYEYVNCTF